MKKPTPFPKYRSVLCKIFWDLSVGEYVPRREVRLVYSIDVARLAGTQHVTCLVIQYNTNPRSAQQSTHSSGRLLCCWLRISPLGIDLLLRLLGALETVDVGSEFHDFAQ